MRLTAHCGLLDPDRLRKKHKRAKKALNASQGSATPGNEETIPYPTGQTPGRKDFQLAEFLGVGQEEYNTFIVRSLFHSSSPADTPVIKDINP